MPQSDSIPAASTNWFPYGTFAPNTLAAVPFPLLTTGYIHLMVEGDPVVLRHSL